MNTAIPRIAASRTSNPKDLDKVRVEFDRLTRRRLGALPSGAVALRGTWSLPPLHEPTEAKLDFFEWHSGSLDLESELYRKKEQGIPLANKRRSVISCLMDEGRKRAILIAASILVSRKFAELGGRPTPALEYAIGDAITLAERIMGHIDNRYQTKPPDQSMNSYGAPKRS